MEAIADLADRPVEDLELFRVPEPGLEVVRDLCRASEFGGSARSERPHRRFGFEAIAHVDVVPLGERLEEKAAD